MSNKFQKVRVVKLFASSEYKIRNKAYKTIKYLLKLEFGNDKKQLSETDILAIWKGLYVWLWMQDKPILHEEVVEKISALLPTILSEKLALEFIRGFFVTLNREWPKLDAHRLDKYYMLVRDMLGTSLRWLQEKEWKYLNEWMEILQKIILVPSNSSAMGLKLHFLDIILDELVKINVGSAVATRTVTEVILSLTAAHSQSIYFSKLSRRVVDRVLPMRENLDIDLSQLSRALLEAAAKQEMKGKTRKLFYKLAERFQQDAAAPSCPQPTTTTTNNCEAMEAEEAPVASSEESAEVPLEGESLQDSESVIPASNLSPPQLRSPQKNEKPKKTQTTRKSNGESDSERRVTFGKRYTKKFTRATTTIGVSQGTVKQHEIKSILKRKSQ